MEISVGEWVKIFATGLGPSVVMAWVVVWLLKYYIPTVHKDCHSSIETISKQMLDQAEVARKDFLNALKEANGHFGERQKLLSENHRDGMERLSGSIGALANAVRDQSDIIVDAIGFKAGRIRTHEPEEGPAKRRGE